MSGRIKVTHRNCRNNTDPQRKSNTLRGKKRVHDLEERKQQVVKQESCFFFVKGSVHPKLQTQYLFTQILLEVISGEDCVVLICQIHL